MLITTPQEKKNIQNIAKSHLTGMIPGADHKRSVKTLSTLLENHLAESKNRETVELRNGIKALGSQFGRKKDGGFSGVSFNTGFLALQEGEDTILEDLQEGESLTTHQAIQPASVHYYSTVGRVYSSLFTPLFYRADPSSDSSRHIFDVYEAVIAQNRGNLNKGDSAYEAIQGSLASGRIQEEVVGTGDGATIAFAAHTLAEAPLKAFDPQTDDVTIVQYTWDDAGTPTVEVLVEDQSGALLDQGGANRGSVLRSSNQVTVNCDPAKVPMTATDIVCTYSQHMYDTGNGVAITLKKVEKNVSIKKFSVLITVSYDGKMDLESNPAISNYLNRIRENIVKSSVDISGMDKLYRAGRVNTVVFDKTVPAGVSEHEYMRGLKFSVQRAIAYLAEGADSDVEYTIRSVAGTKVTMLLESIASAHGETYRIVQPVLNSNGVRLAGYMSNSDVEHYCGKYLDLKKRVTSPVYPVQAENEILFGAVPKGEFAEIKPVAVMAIRNILKNEDPTRDNTSEVYSYRSTAHVGFEIVNDKMFSVLAIENM